MKIYCEFPHCANEGRCVGDCRYSEAARDRAKAQNLKAQCTFPKCVCRVACPYMASLAGVNPTAPERRSIVATPRRREAPLVKTLTQEALVAAIGEPCPYCGDTMTPWERESIGARHPTHDHMDPVIWGGTNAPSNLVVVCWSCNHDKADRQLVDWYFELQEELDPRARHVASVLKASRPGAQEDEEQAA